MNAQKVNNLLSFLVCLLLVGLIVVVLVSGKSGEAGDPESDDSDREARTLVVNTITAKPAASFEISRTYTGITRASRTVDLGFARAGRIEQILVGPGDEVKKGEILAELDKRRLELQKTSIDDAIDDGTAARAGISEVDADLADLDLEDSTLTAPFDGTISSKQMSVGSMASPGVPVFRLVQDSELEVWIGVPVEIASEMEEGDYYDLGLGDKTYSAPVTSILPEVDQSARTRTVVFTLDDNASAAHQTGEVVQLRLSRENPIPGYWLPLASLTRETRGLWSVYVVEDDDEGKSKVARHFVEVVHVENDRAWIRGTIGGEVEIVADGTHRIVPGQVVEPRAMGEETNEAQTNGNTSEEEQ